MDGGALYIAYCTVLYISVYKDVQRRYSVQYNAYCVIFGDSLGDRGGMGGGTESKIFARSVYK